MTYNEDVNDIRDELLENMPSTYSKIKGCWLWEMMKVFALKIGDLLNLLSNTADKLNVENLEGDELDAYVSQWTGIIELDNTQDEETTLANIQAALSSYLSQISFSKTEVSYAKLLSVALGCSGVNDIEDFTVNDGYANIVCEEYEVFTLGTFGMEVG